MAGALGPHCHTDERRLVLRGVGPLVICNKCKAEKPRGLFHRTQKCKAGIRQPCAACRSTKKPRAPKICKGCGRTDCEFLSTTSYCRPCWNFRWRKKRKAPVRVYNKRDATLKRRYGISQVEFDAMVERQQGKCLICLRVPKKKLHVDHCHSTKTVRGLLCSQCNAILGIWKEDVACALRAIDYLRRAKLRIVA